MSTMISAHALALFFCLILVFILFVLGGVGYRKKPSSKYLYHVTTIENAQKIVQNDIATIYPSTGWKSYSNWLRPTTFYFAGLPTRIQVWFNIPGYTFKTDLVAVRVEVRNLPDSIKTKSRYLDRVAFHTGPLTNVPAEIVTIPKTRIRFVVEPLLVLFSLQFVLMGIIFAVA